MPISSAMSSSGFRAAPRAISRSLGKFMASLTGPASSNIREPPAYKIVRRSRVRFPLPPPQDPRTASPSPPQFPAPVPALWKSGHPCRQEQAPMAAQHGPVGMVGTGNMGGRITRRMVEAGHDVLAVDAAPARIPACGAVPAQDLAELAARCDVIMLSLPDSTVIETVIRGPD